MKTYTTISQPVIYSTRTSLILDLFFGSLKINSFIVTVFKFSGSDIIIIHLFGASLSIIKILMRLNSLFKIEIQGCLDYLLLNYPFSSIIPITRAGLTNS